MTDQEFKAKFESIKQSAVAEIATAIMRKDAPFLQNVSKEKLQQRAYNASNGLAYEGVNSLLLDIKQAQHGYASNEWISLEEAQKLGASKDEIQNIRDTWRENYADKCAKVHYLQKTAMVNAHKLDEFGQKIPLKNDQGEQRIGKNGEPLFEYDGQVKTNPKTGKSYFEIKQERITLEQPILRTELLYNVEEFKSIDKEKIRELNTQQVKKHLLKNLQEHQNGNDRTRVFFEDLKESLYPETAKQIESYFKAQSFEKDYIANTKNQPAHTIKPEAKQSVDKAIESSKAAKEEVAKKGYAPKTKKAQKSIEAKQQEKTKSKYQTKTSAPKKSKAMGR
ncbi:ArdC family protein [Helicobacter canis]|uniref:ArdC family protein n=1 Tax=Helicobacter canis TaxID=29419 RepID=UPI0029421955|nr:ArdC family protein [Helicobacter canis]